MTHKLPELPYEIDALEPHISAETLEYHHGKHHATYVKKLNKLVEDSDFRESTLEEIIENASGSLFDNAAQVWNHNFYWNCLSPQGGKSPKGDLATAINDNFDSFKEFKNQFNDKAKNNFGSGWTWLVQNANGSLEIVNSSNAGNPITDKQRPLLTCDVWEHAYYIDYRNSRPEYLQAFWNIVNWNFVSQRLKQD